MTWPTYHENTGMTGGWHEQDDTGKLGYGPGWRKLAVVSFSAEGWSDGNDSTWVHKALRGWLDSFGI